ncbi:uncharacterized protein [Triticum aestivum]|uniref:uncharacterized protein n=1 Tax=Triticum aestivum TaxID=4565 RepID=UPI001D0099BF|nr:uncharacterized protein LOC123116267 [Triticum aestivum]
MPLRRASSCSTRAGTTTTLCTSGRDAGIGVGGSFNRWKLQSKVMEFGTGHDAKSFNHGMVAPGDTGSCSRRHGGATTATTKMDGDRRRGRRPTAMWTVTGDRRSATEGEDGDRRRAGDASRSAPGESMAGCPGRIALLDWT